MRKFWRIIKESLESFLIAVSFLTILPLGENIDIKKEKLAKSAGFFPLAGAFIGLLLVAIDLALRPFFSDFIINAFVLIILIIIAGALHLDGFIDSVDGLFSGRGRDRALEIMLDSRAGAFGTIAVICLLLLKFSFLKEMPGDIRYSALIFMPIVSRWGAVYAIYKYKHAETKGTGEIFANFVGLKEFIVATVSMLIFAGFLLKLKGFMVSALIFIILILLARRINKKLGGLTGDVYGAIIEMTELLFLIFIYLIR